MEKPKGYDQEHYADLHVKDQKKWLEYSKYLQDNVANGLNIYTNKL